MNTLAARTIADSLTWVRIASVVPITVLALADLRWWVFCVYIVASLTDFFDGQFARRAQPARYGSAFDAHADVLFTVMSLLWITLLVPDFLQHYGWPLVLPLLLLQSLLFALRFLNPGVAVPHLPLGRFAMFVFCLLLPTLLVAGDIAWLVIAALLIAIAAKAQLAWYLLGSRQRASAAELT